MIVLRGANYIICTPIENLTYLYQLFESFDEEEERINI